MLIKYAASSSWDSVTRCFTAHAGLHLAGGNYV